MTARAEILAAVRAALAGVGGEPVQIPRGYRSRPTAGTPDLLGLFAERVADTGAVVTRCAETEVAAVLREAVRGRRVVVPEGLGVALPGALADAPLSAAELDALDGVVTTAAVGIATTGTIVLDHGPGQGRRAVTLVPDLHVCVVHAHQVVGTVPEAVARLDPRRPQTWITGPSATSDIELSRVEGVHGPRTLHLVLAG